MDLKLNKLSDWEWELPRQGKMRVPGKIFASEKIMGPIRNDNCLEQVANVATLPGITLFSMAMPDVHSGYGFPIGGVAAMDVELGGVVSPGGVGYDINCGCRLATTRLIADEWKSRIGDLAAALFSRVPAGVGSEGAIKKLGKKELDKVLVKGAGWAVSQGFGDAADLDHTEEGGALSGADPDILSERAVERGLDQVGTLGSGNHFLEIQRVAEILDSETARVFGLREGRLTLMIHSGSRGLGHQVCDDFLKVMADASSRNNIELPDRQLVCAPVESKAGRDYLAAMACAANFAWANRQVIMSLAGRAMIEALDISPGELGLSLLYDVCHNIAKLERHEVEGKTRLYCVHRKGATRAFGPGIKEVPSEYRGVGQPVLIPGDMGRCSYVCVGSGEAMKKTFGSTCHGAGRLLSRHKAIDALKGRAIERELADKGIVVLARGHKTLKEEAPEAYKNVSDVVEVMHCLGISRKVAKLVPLAVIKG